MDADEVEEIQRYLPSGNTKTLRACIRCRQIMNKDQFIEWGCPNCRDTLDMQGNDSRVVACTTTNFQGFLSLIRPGTFAARFNGLDNRRPGCYALSVKGKIPDYILNEGRSDSELEIGTKRDVRAQPRAAARGLALKNAAPNFSDSGEEEASDDDVPLTAAPASKKAQSAPPSADPLLASPSSAREDPAPPSKRSRRGEPAPEPDIEAFLDDDDEFAGF